MKRFSYNLTKVLLAISLTGICISLVAQDSLQIVTGTVRNSSNYESISFAVVKNEMHGTKILADEQGQYIIPFKTGDLLKITAIGYEDGFYIINDTSHIVNNFPVQLKPRIYELKEFTLTPYKTVMQFKHAVAQLDLPDSKPFELNLPTFNHHLPSDDGDDLGGVSFMSPISAIYYAFSHKGKMEMKYRKLLANDYDNRVVHKRLNKNLIAAIVPIYTDKELDAFLEFCQFDFSFLLIASDYELIAAVQRKYANYLQSIVR